jgi:hypothetical protein
VTNIDTDLDAFFAVNLRGRTTGLPMNIWLSPRSHALRAARIWVQTDHREQCDIDHVAVVSVEEAPAQVIEGRLGATDLNRVRRYIAQNREAILDHWHGRTDGAELSRSLKPLRPA